ncbi:MAG TPA: preprotein translocase subunit SecE [Candidatus Veblenbacteria bacterium]|uniref:Protein translocase subunit SecE n=5 Tax=Candidatus Vebleniibacteriota TaxID=1817921 RepID=A0A1G2Q549_9BACT|nr:MAG: Protein translocase subunit secE/sec61 gamma [Parcubacteria group bacterium GW2011_GWA1_43_27]KKT14127.1 MAG: Protein translocase subunit secE/sec61 gamma [Parcubacteria group bacterium GW2011_GWF2_43_38]OHA54503.1 MAG: preprotein translocase subunit SecE [Candidatus Veblenbacteria bacterium RIFOXYA2_FULL_43_9]OHA55086.1 MAG: preprotein translocase subunit SecE [Candidatus Veblenbacteria bacterium RIFOXYB1_FULL_43_13]OHA55654.1 MAG: preprotein translocase subunit SecE [Candidatus Veblen
MANPIVLYFKGAWEELKKVIWPTKNEIIQHTLVVIGLSLFLALFLGAADYLLNFGLEKILFYR